MSKEPLIEVKDLHKVYKDGRVNALNGVNLEIYQGEFFCVRGPSGSGKSTLLHLIGGLDRPTSGVIQFEGEDLDSAYKNRHFRIKTFGFVFQAFYLWPTLNVEENILLPLLELSIKNKEKQKRVNELIEIVGLVKRKRANVRELSVGERQRVAIARALVSKPKVLLADEPTGSLDSSNATIILDLFRRINRQEMVTIMLVTHAILPDELWDRGIEILDGRVK